MKKVYYLIILILCYSFAEAKESINPTVSPGFFLPTDQITVTYDVTGTPLATLADAYLWVWIPGTSINAKYNINPATSSGTTTNAKLIKSVVNGRTLFTITFIPSNFFDGDISSQSQMGMLLKGNDWANGQTTDYLIDFWDNTSFVLRLNSPTQRPLFVEQNDVINIKAETSMTADFDLYVNDVLVDEATTKLYAFDYTVTQANGGGLVKIVATSGVNSDETTFQFVIGGNSPVAVRPSGIIAGINYGDDDTKVTLCLWAPDKSSVYVRGDFSNWEVLPETLMKKDGEYFWIELTGLTAGEEYAYQYVVDQSIVIADPYADKILDPQDQSIPASIYADLRSYPAGARTAFDYLDRAAVFQTNQTPYNWVVEDFEKPAKENMVIYEMLIRDFFGPEERSYENLADTISYFKSLGVNAIQLMPVMEFNGNDSWGYNPTFMFAPDKAYGPKNELKAFIDKCHQEGIAVILDIAMNHQDIQNPYVLLDFDFATGTPKPTNKWFNVTAKHPYSVFFDMNHESSYTKAYLDTVNHYWLNEYKVDGFRFDLSKGFTQNAKCGGSTTNEVCIAQKDDSRIAILERMGDEIWNHSPGAILILEHFAEDSEEIELSNHGFMLWGNLNYAFNQNTKGASANSDINRAYYKSRGWTKPHLVTYMESHDEERLAFRNKTEGNSLGAYSTRTLKTSMQRIGAASVILYSIPGPKMLWHFGELGYDYSINTCTDGTTISNDCRVSAKPVRWDYLDDADRANLRDVTSKMIKLHTTYSVFAEGTATISGGSTLLKQVQIKNNPYVENPSDADEMNVMSVANFDLSTMAVSVNFAHTGTWYDYFTRTSLSVTSIPFSINLKAGEYRLYTDVELQEGPITSVEEKRNISARIFPNPTTGSFRLGGDGARVTGILDSRGTPCNFLQDGELVDISHLPAGLYIVRQQTLSGKKIVSKIIKK